MATRIAGGALQRGPDGVNYAIRGEASIGVSPGRTPAETVQRARTIQGAALAPADPSGQDLAVAAQARQMEMEARAELAREQVEERTAGRSSPTREQLPNAYGQSGSKQGSSPSVFA